MEKATYQYCNLTDYCIIKMTGRATYDKCSNFKIFSENVLSDNNFKELVFDLTETEYLDSTNLGLIARLSVKHLESKKIKAKIFTINQNITDTILSTGLDQIIDVIADSNKRTIDWTKLDDEIFTDKEKLANLLVESHETLMNLNDKNKIVFKDVVDMLKQQSTNHQTNED